MQIALVLSILCLAILLFATGWIRMDLVSILILLTLPLFDIIPAEQAFLAFSNPAVITVAAMFIMSAAIANTGVTGHLGRWLFSFAEKSETKLVLAIMSLTAIVSAFINNIGAAAVLLPMVTGIAKKAEIAASRLLMPLAFGSLIGGFCTLIGTPPNILINELMLEYAGHEFSMFDFTPLGLMVIIISIGYMMLFGRHLLPDNPPASVPHLNQVKAYISEIRLKKESPFVGKTLQATGLNSDFQLKIRSLLREQLKITSPRRSIVLRADDILFLEGKPEQILKLKEIKGIEVVPGGAQISDAQEKEKLRVAEVALTPTNELVGKTLREVHFKDNHGLNVLAIWRKGEPVVKHVDQVILKFGDMLLIEGPENQILHLADKHDFLLLGGIKPEPYLPSKAPLAILIMLAVILAVTAGLLPIMHAATLGAAAMILTGCIKLSDAYESINWPVIMLIAGTLPLGMAMEVSGASAYLANQLTALAGPYGPWLTLAVLFLITMLLTCIMSNAATAVLLAPIAFDLSLHFGVNPQPFFMTVALAASTCFMTPVSHQSNALVIGPGGYVFADYLRVGTPLNILIWFAASFTIPLIFPF
ncbi:Di-and tricarboxylate transporter [Malonomonas rubra DSM 5091]|uniref:Di-and tricarboxylate transporter n=1 Tax=Malonomonas rubra DSM 5091 TaxID=1122189 RepID=A0A1M6BEY5_MALRU|nr:SLC13 family permease [Malonomonas rubra]SHI47269.1 Di-and tricarboxylate transporter [Malonomonas rubra DSM 5091]